MDMEYQNRISQVQITTISPEPKEAIIAHIGTIQTILQSKKDSSSDRVLYSGDHVEYMKEIGILDECGYTTKNLEDVAKKFTATASRLYNIV